MRRAPISVLLATLCGCGLFVNRPIGKDANGLDVYAPEEEPPHALLVEGEIRDFVSFRAEPRAVIETWTDDPAYTPKATIDESGHFSLRIDVCRREATFGQQVATTLVVGSSDGCARWLRAFHFRARLGDRCSITYGADMIPKEREPFVLWLRPCTEGKSVYRP
ncbi:hypothetical protein A2cp1_1097 [Anaeromyxobacter dehalogenans 2CP-1]|uniref:Lipoprotein n=1 Tax=Anaeromyxobacter dehalogenans (strain ATCC BAA-258 / DSM 21875 / 2CP-1) TaxID=455488 RepID=B8JF89_ANAD2|nr:hypothetical protein [Anaeromyxobacter dehalogenans]ACL64446.1 hypothetical protein A2cp1_1097 [Anaeromyxobacter dehalogenans 2CP-1]